jgi:hypothetical protein
MRAALILQLKRLNDDKLQALGLISRAALVLGVSALSLALAIRFVRHIVAAVPVAVAAAAVTCYAVLVVFLLLTS